MLFCNNFLETTPASRTSLHTSVCVCVCVCVCVYVYVINLKRMFDALIWH